MSDETIIIAPGAIKPKRVPLYLGEGEDRKEIGYADVEQLTNGSLSVDLFIPGDFSMKGVIPASLRKD